MSEEEIFTRLVEFVKEDDTVVGKQVHNLYYLDIPMRDRHFWSPELRVSAEKDEYADHDDTIIRVNVGPQYVVWAFFVFVYSFLGIVSLFGGIYGLVQLNMGNKTPWVWCLPFTLLLIFGVYLIAKSGQKKGRDQTLHLVSVVYHALGHDNVERIDSY
ncbi:hypothetical protein K6119_04760 [Paracrocinitomix mangrovi]|uniref:hypothetical protein n=1 Tax=Paracrocinitomix mangrovi TaxID=2862509 RepID=UPI001C8DED7E|nr:hypothetical protein [Paracrocinitomix mangrovi]UKN02826.1 hypothetical protein K6119_04760 [Paracrocinitomix mangrovi]